MRSSFILIFLLYALTGCSGSSPTKKEAPAPESACQASKGFNVVGGTIIPETEFPASVLYDPGDRSMCSGTFVSSSVMITAAHCVSQFGKIQNPVPSSIALLQGPKPIFDGNQAIANQRIAQAVKVFMNPRNPLQFDELENHDVAVVVFPSGTHQEYSRISKTQPKMGDVVKLIGYGPSSLNTNTDEGKRVGTVSIAQVRQDQALVVKAYSSFGSGIASTYSSGAVSAPGDSGGTVLNQQNEVVGVMVGGNGHQTTIGNLLSAENREFLLNLGNNQNLQICGLTSECSESSTSGSSVATPSNGGATTPSNGGTTGPSSSQCQPT